MAAARSRSSSDRGGGGEAAARSVCIAVDGSGPSDHMLRWAVRNVLQPGDEITLVHMYEFKHTKPLLEAVVMLQSLDTSELHAELAKQQEKAAVDMLKRCSNVLVSNGFPVAQVCGLETNEGVKEGLADFVNRLAPTLLVIASRGRSAGIISRLFMGSVSDYMVHHATCPVVVVKDEAHREHLESGADA